MNINELQAMAEQKRLSGFASHLTGRADELAAMVPAQQREAVGVALLILSYVLADPNLAGGDPLNLVALTGAALLPVKVGAR